MGLRFEAWTLPWSAAFERKVADIPVVAGGGSGTVRFNDYGEASITLPPGYDRLSDILSDTEGSLIRVYDGTTIIQEFLAERVERDQSDEVGVTVSGPDLKSAFDRAVVFPYDYPVNPSAFPDWIWDGANVLTNPDFEDNDAVPSTWRLYTTASGGTFTLSDGTDTTSAIAYNAAAATIETRLQTDIAAITDVLVTGSGTEADPWQIEFVDPALGVALTVNGGSLTGGSATLAEEQDGSLEPFGWTKSQQISQGVPRIYGTYDTFELSTDFADSGSYSLKINPGAVSGGFNQFAGAQQVVRVKPGGTYQASIKIRTTSATDVYRFVIRTVNGDFIASDTGGLGETAYATGSWHEVTISDLTIPDGVDQIIFRFANVDTSGNPSTFYLDTARLTEGQAAATVGTIVDALMDDASSNHSGDTRGTILTWVDYSGFDATNDSSAVAWDDSLSFTAYRGMSYGQVWDRLVELGYEWDLTPKATPSGGLTHDLAWYNAGNRDDAPETAVNAGQGTVAGSVVKRIPAYTAVLMEGAGNLYREDTDATALTNFGRMEAYAGDRALASTVSLTAAGDAFLAEESTNRTAVQVNVVADPGFPRPLVDYKPGDTIYFQLPPALAKTSRRVRQVTWTNTEPPTYQVTGSRVFDRESGAWEAIRKILRRFRPFEDEDTGGAVTLGGGGGMMTVTVAASNASDLSKSKADYVCTGANDQDTIQAAIDSIPAITDGLVWLSEGTFYLSPTVGTQALNIPSGVSVRGMGMWRTYLESSTAGSTSTTLVRMNGSATISDVNIDSSTFDTGDVALGLYSSLNVVERVRVYSWGHGIEADGANTQIRDCWIYSGDGSAVYSNLADNLWIESCVLEYGYDNVVDDTKCAVRLESSTRDIWITNCWLFDGYHGVYVDAGAGGTPGRIYIAGNFFQGSQFSLVKIEDPDGGAPYTQIVNNRFQSSGGNGGGASGEAAIYCIGNDGKTTLDDSSLSQEPGLIIANNVLEDMPNTNGIRLSGITGAKVHGNYLEQVGEHGIYLDAASDCDVKDNLIVWPRFSSDTYDGIHLADGTAVVGSNRNYLLANRVVDDTVSIGTKYWRYGINVAGTACADNIIVGNDLRATSGATGTAIANSGSGTLLSWPSHGTYGDNFT